MQIQFLKTTDEYKNQYVLIDGQIYTLDKALSIFDENKEQIMKLKNSQKQKKFKVSFKYPTKKSMLKQIKHKEQVLFEKLDLKKSSSAFQNKTIANKLMLYICNNTVLDMSVTEDRLLNLKQYTQKFEQSNKRLEQALTDKTYKNDKQYKKTKKLLKQLQNQVNAQTTKMLYNTLVRKRSANQDDAYTFLYLLDALNVKAYKLTLINKKKNKNYAVVLVAIKNKANQPLKYYIYDVELNKRLIKTNKNNNEKLIITGKNELKTLSSNYELSSLETLNNAYTSKDEEFKKVFSQMSTQGIYAK